MPCSARFQTQNAWTSLKENLELMIFLTAENCNHDHNHNSRVRQKTIVVSFLLNHSQKFKRAKERKGTFFAEF